MIIPLFVLTNTAVLAESKVPRTSIVGELIKEYDSRYGYEMLRPATWESFDLGDRRIYYPAGSIDKPDRVIIEVADLQSVVKLHSDPSLTIINMELFKNNPTHSDWAKAMEDFWKRNEISYELINKSSNSTLYLLKPLEDEIVLMALKVDKRRPIQIALFGFGAFGNIATLEHEGWLNDFNIIVSSTSALENFTFSNQSTLIAPFSLVHSDSGYIYDGAFQLRMMTEWYPETHRVYWLYEYLYHPNYPTHTYWLYATFVTDDKDNTCVYDTGYYLGHSIDKHTTYTNGVITDSYYPDFVNTSIGSQTYHLLRYGDGMYWSCRSYQPFHP